MKSENKIKHPACISREKDRSIILPESTGPGKEKICKIVHNIIDPCRLTPAAAEEIILRLSPLLSNECRRKEN